jgi:hypothetical protein
MWHLDPVIIQARVLQAILFYVPLRPNFGDIQSPVEKNDG